jgi:dUTP pyrophosphatase
MGNRLCLLLKVKLLFPDAMMPWRDNDNDAGLDLYCYGGTVILKPGERKAINTGIAVAIPNGYVGRVLPRSGLAVKSGIDVLAGVIDATYRGEIKVVLINHGKDGKVFDPGDRIAQLVVQEIPIVQPMLVSELDETNRGSNGFGSSGA